MLDDLRSLGEEKINSPLTHPYVSEILLVSHIWEKISDLLEEERIKFHSMCVYSKFIQTLTGWLLKK